MKFYELRQPYLDALDNGGGVPGADPIPEPTPNDPPADPAPQGHPIKVKYNHEEMELPYEEAVQHIQKGMNYDKAVERAKAEATERADKFAKKYGYSSFEEMEKDQAEKEAQAEREQFKEQNGFDPDSVKPLFEQWIKDDPRYQKLERLERQENATRALTELNSELADAGIDLKLADLSDEELAKIPNSDKVTELMQTRKLSLAEAFFFANKKDIISRQAEKAQQDTIKKINANGDSSPGSLSGGGENADNSVYAKSKGDFGKMVEEVLRGERKTL